MNNSKTHVLVCAIGPVQDFIATARTSQDLQAGSWLLSELSKAVAQLLAGRSHELVFPAPGQDLTPGSNVNVANKVVAVVTGDLSEVAKDALQALVERRESIYQETYDKIEGDVDRERASSQLDDLIEFYWASAPFVDGRFDRARMQAEAILAARKNTRNFTQARGYAGVPKSSLDGVRESVLLEKATTLEGAFYTKYHAEPGEALSGVDLLKRWVDTGRADFPSTTDLAVLPFRIMLGREREEALREEICDLLKDYTDRRETPGTYFYSDRLAQLIPDMHARREFQRHLARLLKQEGVDQVPSPYYALLLADGDNMGKTITAQTGSKDHREFSRRLSVFATTASRLITENHMGTPIYVGGDDVLAYLPLHTVLQCVTDLNKEFAEAMEGFTFVEGEDPPRSPTLSAAVVIAHHLTPLRDVLDTAREAEKRAKRGSKHALVVVSSKRGSGDRVVVARLNALLERLGVLIDYARQKQISMGTAYELQQLHQQLRAAGLPEASQHEALRIIARKREGGGGREIQKRVLQQFEAWFQEGELELDELAREMVIAGQFAGAYEQAGVAMQDDKEA